MSNDGYGSDYAEEYGDSDIPTHFTPSAESFVHDGPRDVGIVFIGDSFVAGYGLLAWLVLHGGWETWLQIAP